MGTLGHAVDAVDAVDAVALKNRVLWISQLQSTKPELHGWGEPSALSARSSEGPSLETPATSGATLRL